MTDTLVPSTATTPEPDTQNARIQSRPKLPAAARRALLALFLGGFAIGTTEFVTMGLLPQIAQGTGTDIPTAGHYISAYALGVVVGAPLIAVFGAKLSRKALLMWLMASFAVFNAASGFASDYGQLMVARFLSGLPHGAYFGIGSLVAASLVAKERRTWAVSMMLLGLSVAQIVGVPVTTMIGLDLGWQVPYWIVGGIGALTVLAVWRWVPWRQEAGESSMRAELGALTRLQVWLALLIGVVGFGGMFATYSFIAPTVTELAGFPEAVIPLILAVNGIGSAIGMLASGRIAALGVMRAIVVTLLAIAVMLAGFGPAMHVPWMVVPMVLLFGIIPATLVPLLQTRLMDVAHDGQSLAASLNHATLNVANALGAWLGSVVLAAGLGYEWPSRVGSVLAVLGLGVALVSVAVGRREARRER